MLMLCPADNWKDFLPSCRLSVLSVHSVIPFLCWVEALISWTPMILSYTTESPWCTLGAGETRYLHVDEKHLDSSLPLGTKFNSYEIEVLSAEPETQKLLEGKIDDLLQGLVTGENLLNRRINLKNKLIVLNPLCKH